MNPTTSCGQRGIALVVGLIMLTIITLMVVTALNLSTTNLMAVGNVQFRNETISAANAAIEERLSSTFAAAPATTNAPVDIDNDGTDDFVVSVTPTCIRAALASSAAPSSLSLPSLATASTWHTFWDIDAVTNNLDTGAAARVHAGVRVLLSEAEKNLACP
jgi:Tfp pilus assembly protein PilX